MNITTTFRTAALALTMALAGTAAFADGDIYSRLFEMKQMDKNKDGMVSKDEFLAMVSKLWDMHMLEIKVKGNKMTPEQLKELEKVLGRSVGAPSGS